MDRIWILERNRFSSNYDNGAREFLQVARRHVNLEGKTLCPCNKCSNISWQHLDTVKTHLMANGFSKTYVRWHYHGEPREDVIIEQESYDSEKDDEMNDALHDNDGQSYFNVGGVDHNVIDEHTMKVDGEEYSKLFGEINFKLYTSCTKFSVMNFLVKLMHIKVLSRWSDKSFDMLLQLLMEALPVENKLPKMLYETKTILRDLGLGYVSIHVCKNDCALFWGKMRILIQDDSKGNMKVAHKVLSYFPITPRLKRLYGSRHTTKDMRWHKEKRVADEGVLRHPADGFAWKDFDEQYPEFASDSRNVRLGLASDGFNPFGNMSTQYSIWHVIVMPYNLPP
ncbi:hypothetical protein UlMin_042939 [Ulmus minor]